MRESRNYWREAHNGQRARAEKAEDGVRELGVEYAQLSNHLLGSIEQAAEVIAMNEQTAGREEARRARDEACSAGYRLDALLDGIRNGSLAQMRQSREENHFAQKMRAIIRGEH